VPPTFRTITVVQCSTVVTGFDATFGRITEAQDPRIMQFGLKFLF